jgi:hypothetical protein
MAEKVIYLFDETSKEFQGSNLVEGDYTLAAGETEIAPEQGLYQPATFDGTKWVGNDKETWQAAQDAQTAAYLKEHPELAPKPSSEQLMINTLGQQVASLTVQLAQANARPAAGTTTTDNGGAA